MLASSSHMNRVRQFSGDLQDLRKGLAGKGMIETLVNVIEGHSIGKTFQDERDRKTGSSNG